LGKSGHSTIGNIDVQLVNEPAIFFILFAKVSAEIRAEHSDRNQPRAANFALASGTCNAAVNQPVNWDTVSVGVFADAITPNQMSVGPNETERWVRGGTSETSRRDPASAGRHADRRATIRDFADAAH
jgi:hypothetical protein